MMKISIIYDSVFGNTEKIARAIGDALGTQENVGILRVSDVKQEQLVGLNLLIVGSPTRAFRSTWAIKHFLKSIPADGLKGVKVAAFDTRMSMENVNSRMLHFLVNIFGYAAGPIAEKLRKKAGGLSIAPEGFIVKGTKGPLKEGELERAAAWAKQVMAQLQTTIQTRD
jgi:flavodoxin